MTVTLQDYPSHLQGGATPHISLHLPPELEKWHQQQYIHRVPTGLGVSEACIAGEPAPCTVNIDPIDRTQCSPVSTESEAQWKRQKVDWHCPAGRQGESPDDTQTQGKTG